MKRFTDGHIHIQVKPFETVRAMLDDVASIEITDARLLCACGPIYAACVSL